MPFKGGQKSFKKPWASGPLTIKEKIAKIMAVAHCAIKLENRHFQKGFEPPTPTSKPSLWMCDKCIDSWSLRGPGPGEGRGRAGGGPGEGRGYPTGGWSNSSFMLFLIEGKPSYQMLFTRSFLKFRKYR